VFNRTGVDWGVRPGGLWGEEILGGQTVGGQVVGGWSGDGPGDDDGDGRGGSGGDGDDFDGEWEGGRRHYSRMVRAIALIAVVSLALATVGTWTAIALEGAPGVGGTTSLRHPVATVESVRPAAARVERVTLSLSGLRAGSVVRCAVTISTGGSVLGRGAERFTVGAGGAIRHRTVAVALDGPSFAGSPGDARLACAAVRQPGA
jgi:hypothetical protein